jgi:hypothetical protein
MLEVVDDKQELLIAEVPGDCRVDGLGDLPSQS